MDNQEDASVPNPDEPIDDNPYESPKTVDSQSIFFARTSRTLGIGLLVGLSSIIAFCCSCFAGGMLSLITLEQFFRQRGELNILTTMKIAVGSGVIGAVAAGVWAARYHAKKTPR